MRGSLPNEFGDAEVFASLGTPRSAVEQNSGRLGTVLITIAALALGGLTFVSLNAKRADPASKVSKPDPGVAPIGMRPIAPAPTVQEAPVAAVVPAADSPAADFQQAVEPVSAPVADVPGLIFDAQDIHNAAEPISAGASKPTIVATALNEGGQTAGSQSTPNEKFAARMSNATVPSTMAQRMGDTSLIATQGTIIPAILETAINSDLPGYARAVVSRDVRGFDGSKVLIPRGTKLIGQYKSGTSAGQTRAFVIWSRLITPSGVSVELDSPAVDETGKTGVRGETNSHFLTRFGSSILLSVIDSALNIGVAKALGSSNSIIISTPQQATNAATVALQRNIDLPITISVLQGTPIKAFIAQDIDFTYVSNDSAGN